MHTSHKKAAFSNIQKDKDMKKIFLFQKTNEGNDRLIGRYDSTEDAQSKALDLVEDNITIFDFYTEAREYEDITNRVKSYADACKVLGIEPMDESGMKAQGFRKDEITRRQLETITEALNEGWKPNWADTNEYKYYPWFDIEVSRVQTEDVDTLGASAGLSCADTNNAATNTNANIGSRLCFHDRETARYAGRTFTDLYAQFLIEKL